MKIPVDYYNSLNETLKNPRRKELYESKVDNIESLKTTMFDCFNVDLIYVINDFFDKELFSLSKLPVYMEMNQYEFEEFVESTKITTLKEDFDVRVKVRETLYHYYDDMWHTESYKINKKERI